MEREIDLMNMIKYFWSKKIIIIIAMIIGAVLGLGYTKLCVTPLYTASTSLILVEMEFEDEADVVSYSKLVDRYSVVASSRSVVEKVKENLKLEESVETIKGSIVVTGNPDSYSIKLSVTDDNAKDASNTANELAKVFKEEINELFKDEKIKVLDCAVENTNPINDNLIKNILISSLIGVIIICGYYLCIYILKENNEFESENKN